MNWPAILKSPASGMATLNLCDYARTCADFSWEQARAELDGLPGQAGLNIAHEVVDRHADGPRAKHIAWRWLGKSGEVRDYTFADVRDATNRFANVLNELGLPDGDTSTLEVSLS